MVCKGDVVPVVLRVVVVHRSGARPDLSLSQNRYHMSRASAEQRSTRDFGAIPGVPQAGAAAFYALKARRRKISLALSACFSSYSHQLSS